MLERRRSRSDILGHGIAFRLWMPSRFAIPVTTMNRRGRTPNPYRDSRWIHSTRVHLSLYTLLLIATPFLMCRTFMQDTIGRMSASRFSLGSLAVPRVPIVAVVFAGLLLLLFRPRITVRRAIAVVIGLAMFAFGQQLTDLYFGHRFYELQMNWHYLAYCLFAFLSYRHFRERGMSLTGTLLTTVGLAALYSAVDEGLQVFISNRVFDMSDIGKDFYGAFTGMTMVLIGGAHPELARGAWKRVRRRALQGYFTHAPSAWVLLLVTTLSFLGLASILTESEFVMLIILLALATVIVFLAILHLSQFRWPGRVLLGLGVVIVLAQSLSFIRHRGDQIVRHEFGLTVYKGVPIPFFDVMFFPNGGFRLVDKKHYFVSRDRGFFLRRWRPDILLIGAGYNGQGGKGFPHLKGSRFIYNPFAQTGVQVIILNSSEACDYFNRLKAQGKNVLFVLHTTC